MIAITGKVVASTVTNASQQLTLVDGQRYLLTCTTNAWIELGSNPEAAVGAAGGSTYLPANVPVVVMAQGGFTKLAVIRDTADGVITATQLVA